MFDRWGNELDLVAGRDNSVERHISMVSILVVYTGSHCANFLNGSEAVHLVIVMCYGVMDLTAVPGGCVWIQQPCKCCN